MSWYVWKMRNEAIFEYSSIYPAAIKQKTIHAIREWNISNICSAAASCSGLTVDQWLPPPYQTFKLNFDDSLNPFSQTATMGGIVRIAVVILEFAFTRTNLAQSPLEAELLALLKGVTLCIDWGIKKLIL